MALMYAIGDCLVSRDELLEKSAAGALKDFNQALGKRNGSAKVQFSCGTLSTDSIKSTLTYDESGQPIKHVPIGIGKPLTIEIRHIYTGRFPRTHFLHKSADMLVTSAMKGINICSGAPRAVNLLQNNVKKQTAIHNIDPIQSGTPIIFYSPALTQLNSTLKMEMAFEEFPSEFFDAMRKAFGIAAGIPAFAPASPYLVVAGELLNLISVLGKASLDSMPEFEATTELTFDRPGGFAMTADFRLLMDDQGQREINGRYKVNAKGILVNKKTDEEYLGDSPYVTLSFDGRQRDEYRSFTPTAATADVIGKFISGKNIGQASIDTVLSAMKLYNDWDFRQTAIKYNDEYNRLKATNGDPSRVEELKRMRDAAIQNIEKAEIRPKFD